MINSMDRRWACESVGNKNDCAIKPLHPEQSGFGAKIESSQLVEDNKMRACRDSNAEPTD
jgi:hypothetical protein